MDNSKNLAIQCLFCKTQLSRNQDERHREVLCPRCKHYYYGLNSLAAPLAYNSGDTTAERVNTNSSLPHYPHSNNHKNSYQPSFRRQQANYSSQASEEDDTPREPLKHRISTSNRKDTSPQTATTSISSSDRNAEPSTEQDDLETNSSKNANEKVNDKTGHEKDFGLGSTSKLRKSKQNLSINRDTANNPIISTPSEQAEPTKKHPASLEARSDSQNTTSQNDMYRYPHHRDSHRPYYPRDISHNRYIPVANKGSRNILWGSMCILMLLLIFAQYTWDYFGDIRKVPVLRHIVSGFCPLVGCEVSNSEADVRQIFSVIDTKIKRKNNNFSLEGKITNNSAFVQKLPNLAIKYYDQQLQEIAETILTPPNYQRTPLQSLEPNASLDYVINFRLPKGADSFRVMPSFAE